MKLFLAWSGKTSYAVAHELYGWLPCVIQAIRPFMSTENIEKGSRWYDELAKELGEVSYGIICVTQDNYKKPWINFEAGAISNAVFKSNVSPFLFKVEASQLEGPLQQFQSTVYHGVDDMKDFSKSVDLPPACADPAQFGPEDRKDLPKSVNSPSESEDRQRTLEDRQPTLDADKEDFFKLVHGINSRLPSERQVPYEVLRKGFDHWWPELRKTLDGIPCETKTHTGYDWLYTTDDVAKMLERVDIDLKCKCVWVITPHVWRNVLRDGIQAAIKKVVCKDKISYKFLIPDDDSFKANGQALIDYIFNYDESHRQDIRSLCEQDFKSLAVTDYIVVHPSSMPVQVFLELPLTADQVYWTKVTDEAAKGFELRFSGLLGDEKTETASPASYEFGPEPVS